MKLKTYNVVWEIQLEAKNPLDAATEALGIMLDSESCATQFYVQEDGKKDVVSVDLMEPQGNEVLPVEEYKPMIKN